MTATVPTSDPRPHEPASPPARVGAAIASVGTRVPETVVSNAEVAERIGVTDEWIVRRTGIKSRHIAEPQERLATHAIDAAAQALDRARVNAADVDLVLVATTTADEVMPNAAPLVAHGLGANRAGAYDIGAACSGFLSALSVGVGYPGRVGPIVLGADGAGADHIFAERAGGMIRMRGHETFREAVARLTLSTVQATRAAGKRLEEIDLFVYHQANGRILSAVGERLNLPPNRVVDCIGQYGNTSAATLPLALAYSEAEGRLSPGDQVLLGAFGAGFTWGATVVQWGMP